MFSRKRVFVLLFVVLLSGLGSVFFSYSDRGALEAQFLTDLYSETSGSKPVYVLSDGLHIESFITSNGCEIKLVDMDQIEGLANSDPDDPVFYTILDLRSWYPFVIVDYLEMVAINDSGEIDHIESSRGGVYAIHFLGYWHIKSRYRHSTHIDL